MSNWQYQTSGIPDNEFIRGSVPMTKEEVRTVSISKLRLKEDNIVYDIGAGTGSLTIEAALVAKHGHVYAIEREAEGIELINNNLNKFEVKNVELIHGQAPQALTELPMADRVIIGGSGGNLEEILELVNNKLSFQGRILINAITLNTLHTAIEKLKNLDYEVEVCNIAVTRTREVGNYQMLQGLNPVYIISGQKG